MSRQDFLKKLKEYGISQDIPNISESTAQYIRKVLSQNSYKTLLEIGTANGYSTIQFADEMESIGWHITTIEFSLFSHENAKENFKIAQVESCISALYGDARKIIPELNETFDCIFIDGLKKASLDFYLLAREKLNIWGTIIVDDVIKFRHKMENFYEYLEKNNIPYELVQTDPDDGIMILKK